ncbi:MAG TPA: YgiT-type zinc finger protein [Aggregatilineales bacterium]|nr:YgiT-type zinc finger protein [Aggregatilineales bacterium]
MSNYQYPCEFCDTTLSQEKKLVTVSRQRKGKWFVFENVEALVCPNCGHRYFDANVLETMESQMEHPPSDARPIEGWAISLKG